MREVKFKRWHEDYRIMVDGMDHGYLSRNDELSSGLWGARFLPDSKFRFPGGKQSSEVKPLEHVYLLVEEAVHAVPLSEMEKTYRRLYGCFRKPSNSSQEDESMEAMRERHKKEIEGFQAACKHEEIGEWTPYEWAPVHRHTKVRACIRCQKIIEEACIF